MPANPDSLDLVQLEKQESAALGGDAADELPFAAPIDPQEDMIEVAGVAFQEAGRRDRQVAVWPDGNHLRLRDINNPGTAGGGHTLTDLLSGGAGGGITESEHDAFDKLLHNLDESHELIPSFNSNGVMTQILARPIGGGNTVRVFDQITKSAKGNITGMRLRLFDVAGSLVATHQLSSAFTSGIPSEYEWTKS